MEAGSKKFHVYLPKNHLPNFFLNVDIGFLLCLHTSFSLCTAKAIEISQFSSPSVIFFFFCFIVSSKNNKEPRDIEDDNEKVTAELEAKSFSQIIEHFC